MQTSTSGGVFAVTEPCRECRGRGMVVDDPCPVPWSGRASPPRPCRFGFRRVLPTQRILHQRRGGAGENGGAAGDLYVTVHVRAHPIFGRKGDNLTLTAPVTFQEAALGAEISAHTGWTAGQVAAVARNAQRAHPSGTRQGRPKRDGTKATRWSLSRCWCPRRSTNRRERLWNSYAEVVGTVNPRAKLFAAG